MAASTKICVGVIMGAHGVRGAIRLRSFTDEPEAVFKYKPLTDESGTREFAVKLQGVMKDHFVAALKDSATRESAEALRGVKLYVERAKLPKPKKGEYYEADLAGLAARTAAGEAIGTVIAAHDYGGGPFLEIQPVTGSSFMLPFNDDCVPAVDMAGGAVTVAVPEGWLDPPKPPKDETKSAKKKPTP